MGPLLLKSFYVSPIWGGSRIAEARGIPWTSEDKEPSVVHLGPAGQMAGSRERIGVDAGFYRSYVDDVEGQMGFSCNGRYAVLTCVDGVAKVCTPDGDVTLGYTQSCLVPAAARSYTVAGPCRVLRSIRTPEQR